MSDSSQAAKDAVRKQYGSVGDAYVKSVGHATGNDLVRMVELAKPKLTDDMLDVATGGGHVARAFAPHVSRVVASDLTPQILGFASAAFAEWGLGNVTTSVADAEALPFADGSFDIVTCRIAPHHFPNPSVFVHEVARVLRAGGRFVLVDSTVPAGDDGVVFNAFEKLRDPSHVRSLTIDEWMGLLEAAGFVVEAVESFPKRHDFAEWTSRSHTGEADRVELERMIHEAPTVFRAEFDADNPEKIAVFHDTKTLFLGLIRNL